MKKTIIIISSLLMVSLVAGSVFAWGPGKGQRMGSGFNQDCPRYGGQNVWNNLSQDQRDELGNLHQKFIDETYQVRSAKFQKQQEMRMLMEISDPDRTKLDKLSQEITDLQKQVRDNWIDFRLAAKKISPELGMGKGFGKDRGKGSNRGGRRGCQGQGIGWYNNN
ncbi:MAG: periplasmic heavy metal sensor [Desulfobacula sp.]|uniref:Spy/CpxP family protein refolding chaperone n=1 Tax=Desulfobacula sp. TaxID=2593537 RepID=UPI0025BA2579|nr:periplasmic heavy metal sensor [Desulfobacula sp.]MCD4720628.1 periplasmic heavy metal sensor [Desulfobacula sp.]